jgi:uncharacterized protein (TIRG00374 family)
MNKKKLTKIAIILLLFVVLFTVVVDWRKVISAITGIKLRYYILGYLFATLSTFISIYRWDRILQYQDQKVDFKRLTALYYIGKFYNLLIPGSISGDAVRGYKTSKEDGDSTKLATSVAIERIVGLIATLLVMIGSLIYLRYTLMPEVLLQLLAFIILISIGLITLLNENIQNSLIGLLPDYYKLSKLKETVKNAGNSLRSIKHPALIIETTAISLLFILISKLVIFFVAKSLGVSLSYFYILAVSTIIGIITMAPISFGGLGVREGLFVYFFGFVGVSPEKALAIGIVGYSMRVLDSLLGGLADVYDKRNIIEN